MPDLVENSIITLNFDGILDGQQVLLTTAWRLEFVTLSAPDPNMAGLFDAWHGVIDALANLNAAYLDSLSHDMTVPYQFFQAIWPTRYVRRRYTPGDGEGHVIEDALPPNVAHVITLQTDVAVPRRVSNKHIGGVPSDGTLEGYITAPQKARLDNLRDWLITPTDVTYGGNDYRLNPVMLKWDSPNNSKRIYTGYTQTTTRVERRRTVGLGS